MTVTTGKPWLDQYGAMPATVIPEQEHALAGCSLRPCAERRTPR